MFIYHERQFYPITINDESVFEYFSFLTNPASAQSFKFDFGTGAPANGYTKVTPGSKFSYAGGFGFNAGSKVTAIKRKGNDILKCDYITSDKPFYFSVKIPEGNYDVKIILGDKVGTSATTVRAESRRLFLQNIRTKKAK
jgi:Beta-agarase/YXIM esterase-like, galactose-binding domain-like